MNNLFQICFDHGTLELAVKTFGGWKQLDKGEHPTPDFDKIPTSLISIISNCRRLISNYIQRKFPITNCIYKIDIMELSEQALYRLSNQHKLIKSYLHVVDPVV